MLKSDDRTLLLGAVVYDPKVVTIWEGFKDYFIRKGLPFDYVLHSNYERQVENHLAGVFHVAWNSPLAWIRTERMGQARGQRARALLMRDTDQDLTSLVVVRAGSGIESITDLKGKRVAVGAVDSPQATLIPLSHLNVQGLRPGFDFEVMYHDSFGGTHGNHIGGEREAVRALIAGKADAACLINRNYLLFTSEGILPAGSTRVLTQTAPYDHCNFTVIPTAANDLVERFRELLLSMSYDDPELRPLMDLEGLKAWSEGRVDRYQALEKAVDEFGFYDREGRISAAGYRY